MYYHKPTGRWIVAIFVAGKRKNIGYFDDEVKAARAYDRAAVQHFGEFARLNFPDEWPPAKRRRVHARARRAAKKPKPAAGRKSKRRAARIKTPKDKKQNSKNKKPRAETPGRRAPRHKRQRKRR